MFRLTAPAALLVFAGIMRAEAPPVVLALKGLDPVELTNGKEAAGKEDLTITRGRYRYQFATKESKAAFEKTPQLFAIQWGGACGRMGPLSGSGNPERWYVHDKRIFIFASEGCRTGFKAAPARYLESAEEPPTGTASQQKRGKELVALALAGFGGAEAVDGLKSLHLTYQIAYPQKGKEDFLMKKEWYCSFPGLFREEDSYTGWSGVNVATTKSGFSTSKQVAWALEDSVREVIVRQFHREPIVILKARDEKGFVAVAGRNEKVGDTDVELLEVGVRGATTTLAVDPKSGRILQARFQGRGGAGFGGIVKSYSDFKEVSKLLLPHTRSTEFEGKPIVNPKTTLERISVNEKLDPTLFEKPE